MQGQKQAAGEAGLLLVPVTELPQPLRGTAGVSSAEHRSRVPPRAPRPQPLPRLPLGSTFRRVHKKQAERPPRDNSTKWVNLQATKLPAGRPAAGGGVLRRRRRGGQGPACAGGSPLGAA